MKYTSEITAESGGGYVTLTIDGQEYRILETDFGEAAKNAGYYDRHDAHEMAKEMLEDEEQTASYRVEELEEEKLQLEDDLEQIYSMADELLGKVDLIVKNYDCPDISEIVDLAEKIRDRARQ